MTKLGAIYAKSSLIVVFFPGIELLNPSRMVFFMIMIYMQFDVFDLYIFLLSSSVLSSIRDRRESTLNAKSRFMNARAVKSFSCHDLKLEAFNMRIELMLVIILAVDITK